MNTKHLQYFLEISRQRNMNKAAETLFVSQSSLSQFLSRLEAEQKTPLFYRKKGNMTLTPAGQIYRDYAEQVLRLEQEMQDRIRAISASPPIRVGVNSIWANRLVTAVAAQFHLCYPDTQIQLFDENHKQIKQKINDGTLDIAVLATDSLDHVSGTQKILGKEEIVFAVSNRNAALLSHPDLPNPLPLSELFRCFGLESYILNKPNSSFRPLLNDLFAANDFHPAVSCEVSNMNTARDMVNHNMGVSFLPASIVDPNLAITYFSVQPRLTRLNAMICRDTLIFTEPVTHFLKLAEQHY